MNANIFLDYVGNANDGCSTFLIYLYVINIQNIIVKTSIIIYIYFNIFRHTTSGYADFLTLIRIE